MVRAVRAAGIARLVIPGALTCRAMETLTEEERRTVSPEPERADGSAPGRSQSIALLVAMRPPEWIKNLLVFAGLLFSQKLKQGPQIVDALMTFIAFCAISSAGYLVNDLATLLWTGATPRSEIGHRQARAVGGRRRGRRRGAHGVRDRALIRERLGGRRRARRALRGDHRCLLRDPQAAGDHRRDDDRVAVHPPCHHRCGRGRGARVRVAAALHRDAGAVPRLHQAPPGGDGRDRNQCPVPPPRPGSRRRPIMQRSRMRGRRVLGQPGLSWSTTRCHSSTRWLPWSRPARS